MDKLTLGLIQMRCQKGSIEYNIISMYKNLEECRKRGVDIACFPEANITGYINPHKYPNAVISGFHSSIQRVADMSFIYQTVIIAGFVEVNYEGKPFVTQLVAKDGKIAGYYRKRRICGKEAEWFSPGTEGPIFTHSGIKFGLAICEDIDEEELYREYASKGASLILVSAAPGLYGEQNTRDWESGFNWWKDECGSKVGRYAKENQIYISVSTQAGRTADEDFPGGGYLFTPRGECAFATEDWSEGILTAEISLP